jgi:hypothetical protein
VVESTTKLKGPKKLSSVLSGGSYRHPKKEGQKPVEEGLQMKGIKDIII